MSSSPLLKVRVLDGGYCRQLARLAGQTRWRFRDYHALFLHVTHPLHGEALIDTGYHRRFLNATQSLPGRLYRMLIPVAQEHVAFVQSACYERHSVKPAAIKTVFVSHFHGDHFAGLGEFCTATFVYQRAAFEWLLQRSAWQQVRAGFLRDLLPEDFRERSRPIEDATFRPGEETLGGFRICDFWGDGSLVLVDLPGHAIGHTGFLLNGDGGSLFYLADATWDLPVLRRGGVLPWLTRHLQHSYTDYCRTQSRIRDFVGRAPCQLLACHCEESYRHAEGTCE